jgi:hypothetical protein
MKYKYDLIFYFSLKTAVKFEAIITTQSVHCSVIISINSFSVERSTVICEKDDRLRGTHYFSLHG